MKRKIVKADLKTDLKDAAFGIAGGIAANQASTALEKSSALAGNEKYAPLVVSGIALLAMVFLPKTSPLKKLAFGALIVSGTEQAEDTVSGLMSGQMALGFTPQLIPEQFTDSIASVNGVAIR